MAQALPQHVKYPFIDALRGYAVLLVITCHVGGMFAGMPYPVKKLTNFGWHGVQLFFLMSCVTLLLSWRSDQAKNRASVGSFWVRRFFRIAPLYYLAAGAYFLVEPPVSGFDLGQLLASVTFVNAWHPSLIPTVPDRWMVVPGGWSIGVEFTFYAIFPLVAICVRSLRSALVFLGITLLVGCVANTIAYGSLDLSYGETATNNFLYFWFPNQAPVFALGTVLFYMLRWTWDSDQGRRFAKLLTSRANTAAFTCIALCVVLAEYPAAGRLPFLVPSFLLASVILMILALVLGNAPQCMLNNRLARTLGKVSFSAYLIHFGVLHTLPAHFPTVFHIHAENWYAIATLAELWVVVFPLTFALSYLTYHAIEVPMINLGRRLLAMRRAKALTTAFAQS